MTKDDIKILLVFFGVFLLFFFLPLGSEKFTGAIFGSLELAKAYAREHVILCLLPAFFIAGAIGVFVSSQAVIKYFGPDANSFVAYGTASVSGGILAVCSCTVLPLFAGIRRSGSGIGPATTFLYAGPAINITAIALTYSVLGPELATARVIGAVFSGIVVGVLMRVIFKKSEEERIASFPEMSDSDEDRSIGKTISLFGLMILILIIATWSESTDSSGWFSFVAEHKKIILSFAGLGFATLLYFTTDAKIWKILAAVAATSIAAFAFPESLLIPFSVGVVSFGVILVTGGESERSWFDETWNLSKKILPLLFIGVLLAGFAFGGPGREGIVPSDWISSYVGTDGLASVFLASMLGALTYFATLTEIPILQGLMSAGMAKGPALALLLAGPALSLPNMLVIKSVLGWKMTLVYVSLVVVISTISGLIYGYVF